MASESGENLPQLVIIGSSAGGVDALLALLPTLPPAFPAPIVLAQHVDPHRTSHLAEILRRQSPLPVQLMSEQVELRNGTIYVVPPNHDVEILDGSMSLRSTSSGGPIPSIDRLLISAAAAYGERLIAVILTGSGSDGARGAVEVKQSGGTVIIQDPSTATYPSMPLSLAPTSIDLIAKLENIGRLLHDLLTGASVARPVTDENQLQAFLDQLRERSGIDFSNYKAPTILRRLTSRMLVTGTSALQEYVRYQRTHPEEYQRLINSFLIKVTGFFRDPELFDYLRERVLPEVIDYARLHDMQLRFWSAGCATGEEAYSLAILVSEALRDESDQFEVRIFATDLDADAIAFARRGIYAATAVEGLAPELLQRYLTAVNGDYEVGRQVRSMVIFGQHDLGQRAPFPRIDLTLCRNVLIYFTPELQKRALQLFAFSIRDRGFLALGKAETTGPLAEHFALEQPRLKVYRRVGERVLIPAARHPDMNAPLALPLPMPRREASPFEVTMPRLQQREAARARHLGERFDRLLASLPVGVVVVDRRYDILTINGAARQMLNIRREAIGDDLIHLVREGPAVRLRENIDAAFRGEMPPDFVTEVAGDDHPNTSRSLFFTCRLLRFEAMEDAAEGLVILVMDVTAEEQGRRELMSTIEQSRTEVARMAAALERLTQVNRELLRANEELTAGNAELRSTNEEYLIAQEEAQAASEEIETLNEELQASNEELETLNEELQATVEELNTSNDELQSRTVELQELAASREEQRQEAESERERVAAVLQSMSNAVLVVDSHGRVLLTNAAFDSTFGEAGVRFVAEDPDGHLLPLAEQPQRRAAHSEVFQMEFTLTAVDGSRRWFEAIGRPIQHERAEGGGVLVIHDITDRSLRHLQEEFLAMASHELRTPLTAIQGSLQMLTRLLPDNRDQSSRRYADIAYGEVRRLSRLVDDLFDVSRLQTGVLSLQRGAVDLVEVVNAAIEVTRAVASEPEMRFEAPAGAVRVRADRARIEQVVLNLLTNAVRHAPASDHIDVRLQSSGSEAVLTVRDFGPGIRADDLPHIFSRFFRVSRGEAARQAGLGLGLYISHEIMIAHGGAIEAQSIEGQGATFTLRLPLLTGEHDTARDGTE